MKIKKKFVKECRKTYKKDALLADILGYHPSTLSNFFSGRRAPSKSFIERVMTRLNKDIRDVVKF